MEHRSIRRKLIRAGISVSRSELWVPQRAFCEELIRTAPDNGLSGRNDSMVGKMHTIVASDSVLKQLWSDTTARRRSQ